MVEYNLAREVERDKFYTVAKSNDLVREAKYDLSLGQQRMLNFLISKIPPDAMKLSQIGSKQRLGWITFQVQEFARVFNMDADNGMTYAHTKQWLTELKKKVWWVWDEETGKEKLMSWIDEAEMEPKSGKCSITFDKNLEPYLVALTQNGNYTSYELYYTTNFKSSYSGRFYELFKSYEFRSKVKSSDHENVKTVVMDLEELKAKFDEKDPVTRKVTKSLSSHTYKDFKRVVDRSLNEINQYTDIYVTYEPIKKGKKVIQLKFTIRSIMGAELLDRMAENKRAEYGIKSEDGQMDIFSPVKTTVGPAE